MGTPVDAALWAIAAVLGAAALWMSRPRPPSFDPARIWGAALATLVRGDMERAGKDLAAWEAELRRMGPVHPLGDLLADPVLLGEAHDPALLVGAACSWDALAEGREEAWLAVARRLASVRFVALGPWPLDLPGMEILRLDEPDEAALEEILDWPETRIVFCATEADPLLRWLADSPGLRDRVRALVLLDPQATEPVDHPRFDTEIERATPWLVLRRAGGPRRLETPPDPPNHRRSIRVIDLGEVDFATLDPEKHGRALLLLLAALG